MAGFLDQYDAGESRRQQREKLIKRLVIAILVVAVVGGTALFVFHDYREEQQVKGFFNHLAAHDYKAAYTLFGCTYADAPACRDYTFDQFMEDWGPKSDRSDTSNFRISRSRSCGSGVILTVDFGRNQQEKLWVERKNMTVGFSPVAGCAK